jgi:hypothetical protein
MNIPPIAFSHGKSDVEDFLAERIYECMRRSAARASVLPDRPAGHATVFFRKALPPQ